MIAGTISQTMTSILLSNNPCRRPLQRPHPYFVLRSVPFCCKGRRAPLEESWQLLQPEASRQEERSWFEFAAMRCSTTGTSLVPLWAPPWWESRCIVLRSTSFAFSSSEQPLNSLSISKHGMCTFIIIIMSRPSPTFEIKVCCYWQSRWCFYFGTLLLWVVWLVWWREE